MDQIEANLAAMGKAAPLGRGMDIVIISTACPRQAQYWQERLEETRGQVCCPNSTIISVYEDWPGGAGNALGTLYAFRKAQEQSGIDLLGALEQGSAIAMYHTAGKGTRLAPLSGSERNNKSSVKLPSMLVTEKRHCILTILEAVIQQTAIYAPSRKGRLSVFWGDQIFIPSAPLPYTPSHPVDILVRRIPQVDARIWEEQRLCSYGLVTMGADGVNHQIEKVDYESFLRLVKEGKLDASQGVSISLGSFSLSRDLCHELLTEFSMELESCQGALDSDPHWWMPLSLDWETYASVMEAKGTDLHWAQSHYERMQGLRRGPMLGAVDIGSDSYWWDYGQIRHYQNNILKMVQEDDEAEAMRRFFDARQLPPCLDTPIGLTVDSRSCLIDCEITEGQISNSVLVGVKAKSVDVESSVVINVAAPEIQCNDCLLYNVLEPEGVRLKEHTVRADAFIMSEEQHLRFYTSRERDGRSDWERVLPLNHLSYEALHRLNLESDPQQSERVAEGIRKDVERLIQ